MNWILDVVRDESRFSRLVKLIAFGTGSAGVIVLALLVTESFKRFA